MYLLNCDLLIVMGSRLSLLQTGYSRTDFAPHAKIVHIDIDPTETNKFDGLTINEDTIKDLIKPGWRDLTSNLNESEKQVETTLFNKMDDLLQQQKMI